MLANTVPVFLSTKSGFDEDQCEAINVIVRTARNYFTEKATQSKKPEPTVDKIVVSKYNRILNLLDYSYTGYVSLSFILNPSGMQKGDEYPLAILKSNIHNIKYQGSNSNTRPISLSSLGTIYCDYRLGNYYLLFKRNNTDWPVSDDKPVQYSVFVEARS